MAQLNFNATQYQPDFGTPEPIPGGWYNAAIDESEVKPTKDGSGARLKLRFTILDGKYVGRKVYNNYNIRNNNQQTVEIAYRQLTAICQCIGIAGVSNDSSELHGKPLKIRVKLKPEDGQYGPSNEVNGYKNINDAVPGGDSQDAPQQPQQQNVGFGGQPQQPQPQQPQGQMPWQQQNAPDQPQQPQQPAPASSGMPAWNAPDTQQPWQQQPQPQQPQQPQQPWQNQQNQQPAQQPAVNPNDPPPWARQ